MRLLVAAALAFSFVAAQTASAAEVTVEMLSRDKATNLMNLFKPGVVKIAKGDTVKWVATTPGHNVSFIQGGVPAGVALFSSPFDKEIKFTFTVPGIYLYKCTPHAGMGMIGLVVVAKDKSNLAAVKSAYIPPLAKKRLDTLLPELDH